MVDKRTGCERGGPTLRHQGRLLTCRKCGVRWCWSCALRYGVGFGPSHPNSGWTAFKSGDPAFLVFTCPRCTRRS
jgi:hypothetical protein